MLCMDHQHHVQQMRFFLCVVCVRPDHTQEILRSGQLGHGEMDVQRVAMEIMALHSVGIGNDRREAADELDRLQKQVFDTISTKTIQNLNKLLNYEHIEKAIWWAKNY